jgi:hypothetical protein
MTPRLDFYAACRLDGPGVAFDAGLGCRREAGGVNYVRSTLERRAEIGEGRTIRFLVVGFRYPRPETRHRTRLHTPFAEGRQKVQGACTLIVM